jgi:hypothetical protein
MRYLIILALLLIAGCISESTEVATTNESAGTTTPQDKSGTISTSDFETCLEKCSSGPGSGVYCEDGCRFEQAENTKDTSVCDQLDQKESIPECYGTVAIAVGDIKICDKLTDQEDRNHCVAAFSPR